ncbi:MAG: DNA-binding protein [Firmicutes bacterium HGW-Firmicutes-8]|nr:MAG: DNA-binding protein [Firmicutes bacterium HGW-Firmicutes-8]
MKYKQGAIGRVFVAKIEHGEDLLAELKSLAVKENIRSAWMFIIGAVKSASLVTGPRDCSVPPEPVWRRFTDGREILGAGTVFWDETEPVLHIHSAVGKGDLSLTGCLREQTETYLVVEAVILEISGIDASRALDPVLGVKALML